MATRWNIERRRAAPRLCSGRAPRAAVRPATTGSRGRSGRRLRRRRNARPRQPRLDVPEKPASARSNSDEARLRGLGSRPIRALASGVCSYKPAHSCLAAPRDRRPPWRRPRATTRPRRRSRSMCGAFPRRAHGGDLAALHVDSRGCTSGDGPRTEAAGCFDVRRSGEQRSRVAVGG
jgi:hypothetical protein